MDPPRPTWLAPRMGVLGADVVQLDRLAASFTSVAATLAAAETGVTEAARTEWWVGPAADSFRSAWRTHAATLRLRSGHLNGIADALRAQAEQQRQASSDSSRTVFASLGARRGEGPFTVLSFGTNLEDSGLDGGSDIPGWTPTVTRACEMTYDATTGVATIGDRTFLTGETPEGLDLDAMAIALAPILSFDADEDDWPMDPRFFPLWESPPDWDGDGPPPWKDMHPSEATANAHPLFYTVEPAPNGYGYVITYHFFFPYNDAPGPYYKDHDGDWEYVAVHVSPEGEPLAVITSHHGSATYTPLDSGQVNLVDGRIQIFVANGSHAMYLSAGYHHIPGTPVHDKARGNDQEPPWHISEGEPTNMAEPSDEYGAGLPINTNFGFDEGINPPGCQEGPIRDVPAETEWIGP